MASSGRRDIYGDEGQAISFVQPLVVSPCCTPYSFSLREVD